MWECKVYKICPFKEAKICGHGKYPLIRSYHEDSSKGEKPECYVAHTLLTYKHLMDIVQRYINVITKRFLVLDPITLTREDISSLKKAVESSLIFSIVHHDIGKLTENYQHYKKNKYIKWIRHEIISAYIIYHSLMNHFLNKIEESLSFFVEPMVNVFTAAVYLHHEAFWLWKGYLELRVPTLDYFLSVLHNLDVVFLDNADKIIRALGEYLKIEIPAVTYNRISGNEIAYTLGSVFNYLDGSPNSVVFRAIVSSILHPLIISDNMASEEGRS